MADTSLPAYVNQGWRDTGEQPDPVVLRSEKERGVSSQRRMKADSLVSVDVTLYFDTAPDAVSFEDWFFGDLAGGANWFNWTNPRTGTVVETRIVGGDIGKLVPANPTWGWAQRSMKFEYVRPGFVLLAPGSYDIAPGRILSVQRNSTATYIDGSGVLQTAAANEARYEGGLLLVEAAAPQAIPYSDSPGGTGWSTSTMTVSSSTGPDGGSSARLLVPTTGNVVHQVTSSSPGVSAGDYTLSIFCKAAGYQSIYLISDNQPLIPLNIGVDLSTGDTNQPSKLIGIEALAGGWKLIKIRVPGVTGAVVINMCVIPSGTARIAFVGDGVSGVEVFGASLLPGASDSSYVPRPTAAAVTREADLITVAA